MGRAALGTGIVFLGCQCLPNLASPPPHPPSSLPPSPLPHPCSFMVLQRKDPETAKALHDLMDTDVSAAVDVLRCAVM